VEDEGRKDSAKSSGARPGHAINLRAVRGGRNSELSQRARAGAESRGINNTGPRYACSNSFATASSTVSSLLN